MHLTSITPETRRIVPKCPRSPTASHWKWTFPHFPPANNASKKSKYGDNTYQTPEVTQLWSIGTWWLGNSVRRPPERSKNRSDLEAQRAAVWEAARRSCWRPGSHVTSWVRRRRSSCGPHCSTPLTHLETVMAVSGGSDAHGRHLRVKCVVADDSITGKPIPTVVFFFNLEQ